MGDVRKLWIEGPVGRLAALVRTCASPVAAAVVAHPHPLHGGTMNNPVVFHSDRALNRRGFVTMRVDFRGVGTSEGTHDNGRGEVDDLAAAVTWLHGIAPDLPFLLVGFSFGSRCSLRLAPREPAVVGVVAIGLPLGVYAIEEAVTYSAPVAVVQAEHDEYGTPDAIRAQIAVARGPRRVESVPDTTHLFPGRAADAGEAVAEAAAWVLARN